MIQALTFKSKCSQVLARSSKGLKLVGVVAFALSEISVVSNEAAYLLFQALIFLNKTSLARDGPCDVSTVLAEYWALAYLGPRTDEVRE